MADIIVIKYKSHSSGQERELRLLMDLAPDWTMVADLLDFDPQHSTAIANPGSGRTPEDCLRNVIREWLKNGGAGRYPTTWKGMYDLLVDCEHGSSAKILKEVIESGSTRSKLYSFDSQYS